MKFFKFLSFQIGLKAMAALRIRVACSQVELEVSWKIVGKMYRKNLQAKLLIIQFLCIGNIAGVIYGLSHFLCL